MLPSRPPIIRRDTTIAPSEPPGSGPRPILWVLLVAVVVGVASAVGIVFLIRAPACASPSGCVVTVSEILWSLQDPDGTCWQGTAAPQSQPGGTYGGGQEFSLTENVSWFPGFGQQPNLTVASIEVAPAGFTVVRSNSPLLVLSGTTERLGVTLLSPMMDFAGSVTVGGVVTCSGIARFA